MVSHIINVLLNITVMEISSCHALPVMLKLKLYLELMASDSVHFANHIVFRKQIEKLIFSSGIVQSVGHHSCN
jgi:hypothetical protein